MFAPYRTLLWVYAALLALLAITIGSSFFHLGMLNPAINIGIAFAKAALIFWIFMELREAMGLVRLFAVAAACWLSILFVLGGGDWLTR
jgi:cytochrome c oxidase subunit 4